MIQKILILVNILRKHEPFFHTHFVTRVSALVSLAVSGPPVRDLNQLLFVPLGNRTWGLSAYWFATGDKNVPFCIAVVDYPPD